MSAADRAAARASLDNVKSPLEIMAQVGGSDTRFAATAFKVWFLIQAAEPLPATLRARLGPWLGELNRRREALLEENRTFQASGGSGASA